MPEYHNPQDPAPVPQPEPVKVRPSLGSRVLISGLNAESPLNGLYGVVTTLDAEDSTADVRVLLEEVPAGFEFPENSGDEQEGTIAINPMFLTVV